MKQYILLGPFTTIPSPKIHIRQFSWYLSSQIDHPFLPLLYIAQVGKIHKEERLNINFHSLIPLSVIAFSLKSSLDL